MKFTNRKNNRREPNDETLLTALLCACSAAACGNRIAMIPCCGVTPSVREQAAKIISAFLKSADLTGKTIIPFCTSGPDSTDASVDPLRTLMLSVTATTKPTALTETASAIVLQTI